MKLHHTLIEIYTTELFLDQVVDYRVDRRLKKLPRHQVEEAIDVLEMLTKRLKKQIGESATQV